ncbi:uncharacterized protein B0H18DRAFT_1014720 [Fomitopsis serialis]|uniref:uncharacterized protein n=1 Tax=Fomitopsis serialis TaxID=139415 RepID=UPI002008E30B|nr:uncharacterized protein B0H18DRAFT_1014720 [Neoantrodia serialis]KAH9923481.1 hypothetical protein B0H18DRAFT_1014720 [Neoantrodia serialis]
MDPRCHLVPQVGVLWPLARSGLGAPSTCSIAILSSPLPVHEKRISSRDPRSAVPSFVAAPSHSKLGSVWPSRPRRSPPTRTAPTLTSSPSSRLPPPLGKVRLAPRLRLRCMRAEYRASPATSPAWVTSSPPQFSADGHFQLAPSVPSANAEFGTEKETPLAHAVAHVLSKTHALLTLTHEHTAGVPEANTLPTDEEPDVGEPKRKVRRMRGCELSRSQASFGSLNACDGDGGALPGACEHALLEVHWHN